MKIVLATGIYPPSIGGPATYVYALANELAKRGVHVTVVTYGKCTKYEGKTSEQAWEVVRVKRGRCPLLRWLRYARALRRHGVDADSVYAFSSVSCGVPLLLAHLQKPRKILRLGGDFFWERYTDRGGRKTLREWYDSKPLSRSFIQRLLTSFDHIVFSSDFQRGLYEKHFRLPGNSVIENAVPAGAVPVAHVSRTPFRLLAMSRFVRFKNLDSLIRAMLLLDDVLLTLVGDGPEKRRLQRLVRVLQLEGRVAFSTPIHGQEKHELFSLHELFVAPSLTDISPNAVLEARVTGLPVLMTRETGLRGGLAKGVILTDLQTPEQIAAAIEECRRSYPSATESIPLRPWSQVCDEHMQLFRLFS
ncbi:MAG: glycosyltransferase family 4 protein [Candidatus Peribacteraceae bacterium]|nr:glycosyltransferase family 4 protein [Candidatus Peribacteraceae bacterium]